MCLQFMFLLTMRLAAWLRLSRREETNIAWSHDVDEVFGTHTA
jgi:hypothetical protein